MSGGYFDYNQHLIDVIIDDIEDITYNNDSSENRYSEETIQKFNAAIAICDKAAIMVERIDYLLSGDDSEDTFHERWDKELKGE